MKKILPILLMCIAFSANAQIAVKLIQFRPTGELGLVAKKRISGELLYLQDFEEVMRARVAVSYFKLETRLDTFPTYSVTYQSNNTVIDPAFQVFKKLSIGYLTIGADFRVLDKKGFFLYPGIDVIAGGLNEDFESGSVYKSGSESGGFAFVGLRLRGGAEYVIKEHLGIFLEFTRTAYRQQEAGFFGFNDIGLGCHYIFNPE